MPEPLPKVFVHIGPPKTGTTYLQDVLWQNHRQLAAHGVDLPLATSGRHFNAAIDLRDLDFQNHHDPSRPGSWPRLAEAVRKSRAGISVISNELFAAATTTEIATLVKDLAPAEVHVIYGARDLARQLPAMWQESVKHRAVRSYPDHLTKAMRMLRRDELDSRFWRAQHQVSTLARWASQVSPDRIHVVTLPQRGDPPELLWQRFCAVLGIDPEGYDLNVARSNASLSAEETEVLRLVNKALPHDTIDWPAYQRLVKSRFSDRANAGSTGTRLSVPLRHRDELIACTAAIKQDLDAAGYDIVGSLDDLDPAESSFGPRSDLDSHKVAEAAAQILADALTGPQRRRAAPGPRSLPRAIVRRLRSRLRVRR